MSDSLNLEKVLAIDPKMNVEETFKPREVIYKGAELKSRYSFPAVAWSANSFGWNITPPSMTTVIERALRVQYTLQVVATYPSNSQPNEYPLFPARKADGTIYTGLAGAPGTYLSGVLRNFPLQQCASSIEVKINGQSTSVQPSEYINALSLMLKNDEKNYFCSEFPTQADNFGSYVATDAAVARSVFQRYGGNADLPSRGSFLSSVVSAVVGANTIDTYTFVITEQLAIPPFMYGDAIDNAMGLANVKTLQLYINLDNVYRCLSVMPTAMPGGVSVAVKFNEIQPNLLMEFSTPDPVLAARMPTELVYPHEIIRPENTDDKGNYNNVSAAGVNIPTNVVQLSSIPDKILIMVKQSKSTLNSSPTLSMQLPTTYLRITNLQLNIGNRQALFSTFTEEDLYKMSHKNGLNCSFYDWKYGGQCVVIVDVSRDVGLNSQEVVGQSTYLPLKCTVSYDVSPLSISGQATNCQYTISVIPIIPAKCVISQTEPTQYLISAPSGEEVLAITSNPHAKVDTVQVENLGKATGGSVFTTMSKLLHRGLDLASKVKPEHLEAAKKGLESLGLGGAVVGGKLKHKSRVY